jgi:hypothetical protein
MRRMVTKVRTLITGLLVLAMLALSAPPGSAALAAAPFGQAVAMASGLPDSTLACADLEHGAAMACCHGGVCPASVLAVAPSPQQRAARIAGAAYRVPDGALPSGIATLPGLHPPRTAA